MTKDYKNQSIGSFVAERVVDLAASLKCNHILDEVNIYGTSDKDGSAVLSFEWLGQDNEKFANEILDFLHKIKEMVLGIKREAKEQVEPSITNLSGVHRVLYRLRIWPEHGAYESAVKEVVKP